MAPSVDSDDELGEAMLTITPIRPTRGQKRSHGAIGDHDSDDDDDENPQGTTIPDAATQAGTVAGPVNQNVIATAQRFATKKRLRADQITDLEAFIRDPPTLREAKLFAQGLHLENLVTKIFVAAPPWEPSDDLVKNIYSYCVAVLMSVKLAAYKGNIPKNIVFVILKKHRFDMPLGIEHNPANWSKVVKVVENALTQFRSKIKKLIGKSLKLAVKDTELVPSKERKNIFELTQLMVENTQCEVNVLLCARVAFMRKHYIKDSSVGYWDTVDKALVKLRKTADGDSVQISRAFKWILGKDRETHGVNDYTIDDTVDTFQQEVDDIIGDGAAVAAVQPAEGNAEETA
ncbi:hypothetical protein DFH06DRAFT_1330882 [Mycena polygramma]|nr:hypothetical protein DFH06DRAFT_1330882 [Mycena polygramma]